MADLTSHWRSAYESKFLGAWSLFQKSTGRYVEVTAKISRISDDEVVGEGGRKSRPLQAHLVGSKGPIRTPFILSKKSCTTLQVMTGSPQPKDWEGLTITIYVRKEAKVRAGTGDVLTIRNTKAGQDIKKEVEERARQLAEAAEPVIDPADLQEPEREPGVD